MRPNPTTQLSFKSGNVSATQGALLVRITFFLVLTANLACNLYASFDARGLYADGVAYLVHLYSTGSFESYDTRTTVQVLRQAPIVLLSRYTSATLFECGQVFTFVMLALPTLLCSLCWLITPRDRKAWILFPIASLLIGFAATSIHAIGEAAIATSYYWILLFLLLFRARSTMWQALFLLLCIPAFRLHEGTFPLTAVLLFALAMRIHAATAHRREWLFVGLSTLLLTAILAYQVRWVLFPQFPLDRESILRGFVHFEFLCIDGHFNLPLVTGGVALLALSGVAFVHVRQPTEKAMRYAKIIAVAFAFFALAAILTAITVEASYSPYAQLQARYHPPLVSAALGTILILMLRFTIPEELWIQPSVIFILISLCVAQSIADISATRRWNEYVVDLQSRLMRGRGLIPWETTLSTGNERADINWRLTEIGWVIPLNCIVYAPNGIVNAIISSPIGTIFRPIDPEQPRDLPKLRGIDYAPYELFLAVQKASGSP